MAPSLTCDSPDARDSIVYRTISTPASLSTAQSSPKRLKDKPHQNLRYAVGKFDVFKPYLGNSLNPIDVCVDAFLSSPSFEFMCIQAVQLAALLPRDPPPEQFMSFDATPMHHWYQALLIEFVDCFMRRLRTRNCFPTRMIVVRAPEGHTLQLVEDADVFNNEANAHINAVVTSFNANFRERPIGDTSYLQIDTRQQHAAEATAALFEATSYAHHPPKHHWKIGDPLASEYKKRLFMFEAGLTRLLSDREDKRWLLGLPIQLSRGVNAYKEHYIRHLRKEIMIIKRERCANENVDDVFC